MTVTELIARAAKRLIDADSELLGVRVCPVTLTPEDVEPLRKVIHAQLGKKTFVALSIPGAKTTESDRLYVSGDQSAAERATRWRNEVKVEEEEHLVYASVQVHGKAGGLQDCLTQLREDDLRDEFALWCDEKGSGVPTGLGVALRESGILGRSSVVALCQFAQAILRDRRDNLWEACGHHLPLLNLARDLGLRPSNAAARLEENEKAVSRAATGERTAGVTSGPLAQLREAFRAVAGDVQDRLKRIDLTEHLSGAAGRKKPPGNGRAQAKPSKATKAAKHSKPARPGRKQVQRERDPTELLVAAAQGAKKKKDPLTELERKARALEQETPVGGQAAMFPIPQPAGGGEPSEVDQVWTRAQQAREFGSLAERIPVGLGAMLLQALRSDGYGLRWGARENASALLVDLPAQQAPVEARPAIADPAVSAAFDDLLKRRRAAADLLLKDEDRGYRSLTTLIVSPLLALADRALRSAMTELIGASAQVYAATAKSTDRSAREAALAFDTVSVRARSGDTIVVLSPLHPLWLSQALGRFDALLSQEDLDDTGKKLLVRSLSEAPAAPEQWPIDGSPPLQLSRPIGGLIAYQSAPEELEPKDVADVADRVLELAVASMPHALFGVRVVVIGGDAGPVIEGAASAVERLPELKRVTVHHSGAALALDSEVVARCISNGTLELGALPASGDALGGDGVPSPHVVFRLAPPSAPGAVLQPTAPGNASLGAGSGLLPTEFTLVDSGLRARTPIDADRFPALAAFEAAHALLLGSQPQGAFVRNAWAVSLRSLLSRRAGATVGWDVVLAPRIGRRPPDGHFLLAHERAADGLTVAIVSRDIAPAGRVLRDGFRALGVEDLRPLVLNNLAIHLASVTTQGIISPLRTGEQVLAASVLGMALRRELPQGEAFVAHFEGASAVTLLGKEPAELPGAFAIGFGADGEQLRIVLGYAALQHALDVDAARGQVSGPLADVLGRVAASIALATSIDNVGAVAAREALNWLLWPALASAERAGSKTQELLRQLGRNVSCPVSVVAYLPPEGASKRGAGAKLGKLPVSIRTLDVRTFEALVFGGQTAARTN